MAVTISEADIAAKRHEVRHAYAENGFHSKEYQQGFDELHDMNLLFMANRFRTERGLPSNAKTPYCESSCH